MTLSKQKKCTPTLRERGQRRKIRVWGFGKKKTSINRRNPLTTEVSGHQEGGAKSLSKIKGD